MVNETCYPDKEQLQPSPTNVQPTSAEAVTSAKSAMPNDNAQPEDNDQNYLFELENAVHEHEKSGLQAGEALDQIKVKKLYRKKQEYEKCTWKEYTLQEFGFTPQYANRLIYASRAFDSTKKRFESENRSEEFKKLPETAAFWIQFSRFSPEVQESVLKDLFDNNKELKSNWKQIFYNVIEKQMEHSTGESSDNQTEQNSTFSSEGKPSETPEDDMAAQCNDDTPEGQDSYEDDSSSNERITKLAKEIFQALRDDGDLLAELSTFAKHDMESFVEALLQESRVCMMNNPD